MNTKHIKPTTLAAKAQLIYTMDSAWHVVGVKQPLLAAKTHIALSESLGHFERHYKQPYSVEWQMWNAAGRQLLMVLAEIRDGRRATVGRGLDGLL